MDEVGLGPGYSWCVWL